MKKSVVFFASAVLFCAIPAVADEASDAARQEVLNIVEAIVDQNKEAIQSVTDKALLTQRITSYGPIAPAARQAFDDNFWEMFDYFFWVSMPDASRVQKVELVQLDYDGDQGAALVRLRRSGYEFDYFKVDLATSRKRIRIVDVLHFNARPAMSEEMYDYMSTFMPTPQSTRALLNNRDLTDAEVFQVSELLKAYRDTSTERFYSIFDGLDQRLQNEELLARLHILIAYYAQDVNRLAQYLVPYLTIYEENDRYAYVFAGVYIEVGDLKGAYDSMLAFWKRYNFREGGIPSQLSALALANGDAAAAERHAMAATEVEPSLQLTWWSLLRAQVGAQKYADALIPLTRLEDDFGLRLDEAKLRRDRWKAFDKLVESDIYKVWRADRP